MSQEKPLNLKQSISVIKFTLTDAQCCLLGLKSHSRLSLAHSNSSSAVVWEAHQLRLIVVAEQGPNSPQWGMLGYGKHLLDDEVANLASKVSLEILENWLQESPGAKLLLWHIAAIVAACWSGHSLQDYNLSQMVRIHIHKSLMMDIIQNTYTQTCIS